MPISFVQIDRGRSKWLEFAIQAVSVPVISEVLAFCPILLASSVVKSALPSEDNLISVFVVGIGFFLGLILARIGPSLRATGRWIWTPALALFTIGLVSDLSVLPKYHRGSYSTVLAAWFYDAGGDEGARILLGTCPVYATVAYSVAIFLGSRKAPLRARENRANADVHDREIQGRL